MNARTSSQSIRGFSTLEMLIAMTVLILSFGAVTLMFPGIRAGFVDTELNAEALNVAQKMLENEQALARKDFKLVVATSSTETLGGTAYQKTIEIITKDTFTKQVTAKVRWGAQYGRAQKVELTTFVSNFENIVAGDSCDSNFTGNWATPSVTNKLLGNDILGDSAGLYPITDLDIFRKRLYVTVNGTSATIGANSGTTFASNAGGTVVWSSPSGAQTTNGSFASATLNNGQTTQYLKATGFSFSIPAGATILGIKVDVQRKGSSSSVTVKDNQVHLIRSDGSLSNANRADTATNWPTATGLKSYGSASDLWGDTLPTQPGWSPAMVSGSGFGVAISAAAGSGSGTRTASIDSILVTVTYTKQLYVLNATNPTSPIFLSGLASNSVGTNFTGIAVATSTSSGSFAFVSVNSSATQLEAIDVGTTTPIVTATYTIPSASVAANSIFYKDGYAYIGLANNPSGPEFNVIDVHNPLSITGSPIGVREIGAGINSIYVKNNYAYLATDDPAQELIVLDITDLAHPTVRGVYNASGASGSTFGLGRSAYTIGDTLYFGRYYISSDPEFAILNTTTPTPTLLQTTPSSTYDIGTSANPLGIYGIIVGNGLVSGVNRWLAMTLTSKTGGGAFQVLNVDSPGAISSVATVTLPNNGGGVSLDCEWNDTNGKDYFYAASVPTTGSFVNKGSISIISAP